MKAEVVVRDVATVVVAVAVEGKLKLASMV
jgi:hypothetical protein